MKCLIVSWTSEVENKLKKEGFIVNKPFECSDDYAWDKVKYISHKLNLKVMSEYKKENIVFYVDDGDCGR